MRALLLLCAAALAGFAQTALFTALPEQPVGNRFDMGGVAAGDALETRFRLRNNGAAAVPVNSLTVAGTGFSLADAPPLPRVLAAGAWFDFTVRFEAPAPGAYSASLTAGGASAILSASAAPAHEVAVEEDGAWRVLSSGSVVDFGAVERGSAVHRRFAVTGRPGAGPAAVSVPAGIFALPAGAPREVSPAPGERVVLAVSCAPLAAGVEESFLAVGSRRFRLRAEAVDPPLPRPELVVELPEARSGRQGRVSVRLAGVSRTRAAGLLRLEFEPAAGLGPDLAVVFANGAREAAFSVEEGDTAARFGARTYLEFQTGSTTGTLAFTMEAPGYRERRTLAIAPAPVVLSSMRAARTDSSVEIEIGGIDNTRAVAQLTFTFFTKDGAPVAPGPIRVDASDLFRQYFAASPAAGAFLLRARFPVTGPAGHIQNVEIELVNSAGAARAGTVRMGLAGVD